MWKQLNRVSIPTFSGDKRTYESWSAAFYTCVDAAPATSEYKLLQLRSYLRGEALQAVERLGHSATAYEAAKERLERKYGGGRRKVAVSMEELDAFKPVRPGVAQDVERLADFIDVLCINLNEMGRHHELEDGSLYLKTQKKLTESMLTNYRRWMYEHNRRENMASIREWLNNESEFLVEASETIRGTDVKRSHAKGDAPHSHSTRNTYEGSWRSHRGDREMNKPSHGGGGSRNYHVGERDRGRERRPEEKTINMMGKTTRKCVYCESDKHSSNECNKVLTVADRVEILRNKKACFNCTSTKHFASKCTFKRGCYNCGKPHHTSICKESKSTLRKEEPPKNDAKKATPEKTFGATTARGSTIHPSAVCTIDGIDARIAIDTMSSLNYICTELVKKLKLRPKRREKQTIEQIFGTVKRWVEIYEIEIKSKSTRDKLTIECIKLDKAIITHLPNPSINEIKRRMPKLRRLKFTEESSKESLLPVHILLGVQDYQKIRTTKAPVLSAKTNPMAEYTKLGWILMGGNTGTPTKDVCYMTMTGQEQFEQLCNTDVLGLREASKASDFDHEAFKNQIQMIGGYYETKLPWKPDYAQIASHNYTAKARLESTTKKLDRIGKLEEYNEVMKEQLETGILKRVSE